VTLAADAADYDDDDDDDGILVRMVTVACGCFVI